MGKLISVIFIAGILIAAVILVVKLIGGAISLVTGLFHLVLGLAIIAALIALVIWMFRYAAKHRK